MLTCRVLEIDMDGNYPSHLLGVRSSLSLLVLI
jgi:hypothetical protein